MSGFDRAAVDAAAKQLDGDHQLFVPDDGLIKFAWQMFDEWCAHPDDVVELHGRYLQRMPGSAVLPAMRTMVACHGDIFALSEQRVGGAPDSAVVILVWHPIWSTWAQLGCYVPGGPAATLQSQYFQDADDNRRLARTVFLAHLLSIINQPRIVLKHSEQASRAERRAAQRGGFKAVLAWTRVSWDLSKPVRAKIGHDARYHCVPLHWRRGHPREAEPHYRGAYQMPDAIRPEDRVKWWQWIEETWVGHPAFGVRRSHHAPKLSTGMLAKYGKAVAA